MRGDLTLDDFIIDELLLYALSSWVEGEVLGVEFKLHIEHSPPCPIFLDGEDHPIAILLGIVGIEGDVVFGEDLVFIVHDDGDVGFIIEGATASQVIEVDALALKPFAVGSDDGHDGHIQGQGNIF